MEAMASIMKETKYSSKIRNEKKLKLVAKQKSDIDTRDQL